MNLPSIWRAFTISCILEEIIIEVWGNFIIVHNPPSLWLIFEWAFEQVQWTIIFIVKKVFKIVFKRNPKLTSGIILSNFEFKVNSLPFNWWICSSKWSLKLIKSASFFSDDKKTPCIYFKVISHIIGRNSKEKLWDIILIDINGHYSCFSF